MIMKNKTLHDSLPAYFSSLISCHSPLHSLHSTTMDLPSVSGTHPTRLPLKFCTCCFCYLENYYPYSLLMPSFSLVFKVSLKFYLLREDFFRGPSKGDLSHSLPLFSLRAFFISFIAPHMPSSYFIYIFVY